MQTIDTRMHGQAGITGVFLLDGERPALVESGPGSSLATVLEGLEATGVENLDWILVTHIHLDHAGAAGALATRFPDAKVGVHEVGARHLVDPSKLWSSAGRIYGDAMEELWGAIEPISPDRIVALSDGDKVDLGDRMITAHDTPGHAGHHHAFLDEATGVLFCGDALGVRLPDVGIMRPATPPPEFNLETAVASIEKIRALDPTSLCLTHYGPGHQGEGALGVGDTCDAATEALERWASHVRAARAQTRDLDEVTALVRAAVEEDSAGSVPPESVARMEQTTSYGMNTWGYMRYMDKLEDS